MENDQSKAPEIKKLIDQLKSIDFPPLLTPTLIEKIINGTFDAGLFFSLEEVVEDEGVDKEEEDGEEEEEFVQKTPYALHILQDLQKETNVFLIDHFVTFAHPQSRELLTQVEGIMQQISELLGIPEEVAGDVDTVWSYLWPSIQSYQPDTFEFDEYPRFFLMDQVGISIQHSTKPNFRCMPIMYKNQGFSVFWPIKDLVAGEKVTRDFLPSVSVANDPTRRLRMLAFMDPSSPISSGVRFAGLGAGAAVAVADCHLPSPLPPLPPPPPLSHWQSSLDNLDGIKKGGSICERPLRIYCDKEDNLNASFIHSPRLEIVSLPEQADVLYLIDHVHGDDGEEEELNKTEKVISQFWWNGMIVSKEHLFRTVNKFEKSSGSSSGSDSAITSIIPKTYDLSDGAQLAAFVSEFAHREGQRVRASVAEIGGGKRQGGESDEKAEKEAVVIAEDNCWILKRYRGRQSVDYPITNNLSW